ncbi:MAG: NAD(P)/FAD-dependent oxidoreductase, partial [Bacteroidetes bacterium]
MDVEVLIIGGGIVGLACAAESAQRGFSTMLIERHQSFGQEASSRNSEVIHSGIYYAPGSLKAKFCPTANEQLYRYCQQNNVWANRCGKLIVAVTKEEEPELHKLLQRGNENGVPDIQLLTADQTKAIEPNIRCVAALYLPTTGIVDSHELMRAYMREAKEKSAEIIFGVDFKDVIDSHHEFKVLLRDANGETMELVTRYVINSAGLSSDTIAQLFGINIDDAGYRLYPNRGHYFRVSAGKSKLVSRLVYPVPFQKLLGLGTHITIDRAGQVKLGPDQEFCFEKQEHEWYQFDESKKEKFYHAVKRYFPPLELEDLRSEE